MLGLGLGLTSPAVGGAAVPAGPPWTPADLGVKLKAWWSADDHGTARMTDDGAGLISSWTDKIGGMVITAATTERPTWAATSFNSAYAGLTFNGTANCLTSTSLGTLPTGATGGEIWMVGADTLPGTTASTRVSVRYGDISGATIRNLTRLGVSNIGRCSCGDGAVNVTDTVIDFFGPHIHGANWAGTTQAARIDGRDTTPASGTIASLATGTVRFRMGATVAITPAAFWQGPLRHVLVTTTLTTTEREKLEGWLAHDSGLTGVLPVGHPYKTVAPSGPVLWTPADLGVKLKAWFNADDHGTARMTDDGSGLISSWTDSVGAMAVTGATTERPTWAATSFNSAYAGLTFNGTTNFLTSGALTTIPTGATAGEMWVLASQTEVGATAGNLVAVRYGGTVALVYRSIDRASVTSVNRLRITDGTTHLIDTVVNLSGPHIMGAAWAGTTAIARLDGQPTTPASSTPATLNTGTAILRMGASTSASVAGWWKGIIAQTIVTTTLTEAEREKLEGYWAWSKGLTGNLPGGHTYKSAPP